MPKIVDHEQYREELLLKCFKIFTGRGYDGITLREIASELDISTGSLYHYFPAKSSILEEMFSYFTQRDVDNVLARVKETDSYEKKMKAIFDYVSGKESYFQNLLLLSIDYFRYSKSTDQKKIMNRFIANYKDGIASLLGLPPELGSTIILFLNGLVYNRMLYHDMVSFDEQTKKFTVMIKLYIQKHYNKNMTQNNSRD